MLNNVFRCFVFFTRFQITRKIIEQQFTTTLPGPFEWNSGATIRRYNTQTLTPSPVQQFAVEEASLPNSRWSNNSPTSAEALGRYAGATIRRHIDKASYRKEEQQFTSRR